MDIEQFGQLPAHRVVDGLNVQIGNQSLLDGVDHAQFRVALFGLFEQALGFVEQAHVLDGDHRLAGKRLQQRDLLFGEG